MEMFRPTVVHRGVSLLLLLMLGPSVGRILAQADEVPTPALDSTDPRAWRSDSVTELIGLPEIREKARGTLSLSRSSLVFATSAARASINREDILSVVVGDVKVEMGGTGGKVTRAVIPFGGGSVVAMVTNRQVGLLTISFQGTKFALHNVVFLLPRSEATQAQKELALPTSSLKASSQELTCAAGGKTHSRTVKVLSVRDAVDPVPAEYRALLYEQLLTDLKQSNAFGQVYRDGDQSSIGAQCPDDTVTLTVQAFKKGNAALRASTGPLGMFVGSTSLNIHCESRSADGRLALAEDVKASQRGDSDSLNIAAKIAKSLTKKLTTASLKKPT